MKKIFICLILFAQTGLAVTRSQYLNNIYDTPVFDSDLSKKVRAKNSLEGIQSILRSVKPEIKDAARRFDISPLHIAAAIAGEHALNVGLKDRVQNLNIQRRQYLSSWVNRTSDTGLSEMIASSRYANCREIRSDYYFWYCVTRTWHQQQNAVSFLFPEDKVFRKFTWEFFNPNGIGSTFGLGQMSPLRALMVSDFVAANTHLNTLNFRKDGNSTSAFDSVMDPEKVVYYIAATIKMSIAVYREIARFDISSNAGVTATLYNIGNEHFHANKRKAKNLKNISEGKRIEPPRSNDLGKWVLQNKDWIEQTMR